MKHHVYVIYTGGTIGMVRTPEGYAPAPGYLRERMAALPELQSAEMPTYTLNEYTPLLDSSNMTPADWLRIAEDIAQHYREYDGFVVLHGTDTMAYTASALAFMLQGLRKPVILTGSQIPIAEIRSDAQANLITAMLLAAQHPIPEVCLYFGNRLLRGCRAVKIDAEGFNAFASPNCPPLATVGIHIEINRALLLPPAPLGPLQVQALAPVHVGALRLFPSIPAEIVRNILKPPLKGLVLETYGMGNGPTADPQFMDALQAATDRGVVIVNCTQCLTGSVNQQGYATGSALARRGVISGFDMTAEAALTKMFYLFSQDYALETIKTLMQISLRGELTPTA